MNTLYWVGVVLTTILSASRLTRLVVFDKFPPVRFLRNKFLDLTDGGHTRRKWQLLVLCGYCFSFWATALVVLWGYFSDVYGPGTAPLSNPTPAGLSAFLIWWLVNGTLAASYVAAIIMAFDGDHSDSEDEN